MSLLLPGRSWKSAPFPHGPFELNRNSPQAKGLVAWWPTLASVGNTLRDLAGRGYNGVFTGTVADPTLVRGVMGAALYFDKANDYLVVGPSGLSNGWQAISLSVWFRLWRFSDSDDYSGILYNSTAASDTQMAGLSLHTAASALLRFDVGNGTTYRSVHTSGGVTVGPWYHAAGVWRSGDPPKIYLNGVGTTGSSSLSGSLTVASAYYLGWDAVRAIRKLPGYIAEARIYDCVLSDSQVWQLWDPATRWDLYLPIQRFWAVKAPAGWQSVFGGRGMSPIGSAVIRPGAVIGGTPQ